jgi:hypothetical protein
MTDISKKYLRDMKELSDEEDDAINGETEEKETTTTIKQPKMRTESKPEPKEEAKETAREIVIQEQKGFFATKDIILIIINAFSIIFLIILLIKIPEKAAQLRQISIDNMKDEAAVSFQFNDIFTHKNEYQDIDNLFLDESGIVQFVNEVEKLKNNESSIKKVTFTSQKPIKDKTGNVGIPVVIELSGTWEQIQTDLEKIQELRFLFRPITFETKPSLESSNILSGKYGVLLYVKESLTKSE